MSLYHYTSRKPALRTVEWIPLDFLRLRAKTRNLGLKIHSAFPAVLLAIFRKLGNPIAEIVSRKKGSLALSSVVNV